MWYRYKESIHKTIPRVVSYQVAFYDMTRGGKCFDESFFPPDDIDNVITFTETIEDINSETRRKVFVHFDNGDIYELKLEMVDNRRRNI
jgi:hypothetical protein